MTPKQSAFVDEYVIDFNGTQAAIRAGYSPRSAAAIANENLTKPEIAAAVRERTALMNRTTELTAEYVRAELLATYQEAKRDEWSNSDRIRLLALMVKATGLQMEEVRNNNTLIVDGDLSRLSTPELVSMLERFQRPCLPEG